MRMRLIGGASSGAAGAERPREGGSWKAMRVWGGTAPVNAAIDAWNAAAPPADWQALRDRWEFGHLIRSYVGLVGLAMAHAAALWEANETR